jgi:hypothetical protein
VVVVEGGGSGVAYKVEALTKSVPEFNKDEYLKEGTGFVTCGACLHISIRKWNRNDGEF